MKRSFKELWVRPSDREGYVDLLFITEDNQKIVMYDCYPIATDVIEPHQKFDGVFDIRFSYDFGEDENG